MPRLITLGHYYQERFTFFPWMIVPFILSFLLWGNLKADFLISSIFVLISLLFYRLLDDIMMRKWDEASLKRRPYLTKLDEIKNLIFLPLILYLVLTGYLYGREAVLWTLVFLILSLSLYRIFMGNRLSLFVSILKYPFLSYLCLYQTSNSWMFLATFLFLYHELVSEKFIPFPIRSSFILFISMIVLRITGNFT